MIPLGGNVGGARGAAVTTLGGDVGGAQAKLCASKQQNNCANPTQAMLYSNGELEPMSTLRERACPLPSPSLLSFPAPPTLFHPKNSSSLPSTLLVEVSEVPLPFSLSPLSPPSPSTPRLLYPPPHPPSEGQ